MLGVLCAESSACGVTFLSSTGALEERRHQATGIERITCLEVDAFCK
jgi:hypothetical protein